MPKLYNIKNFTRKQLRDWLNAKTKHNSKNHSFRADQVFLWLYQKKVNSFLEMKNLGGEIRRLLEENFWISSIENIETKKSEDGSRKYRLLLDDGHCIESVLMPHKNHNTLCISSQVGCGMGCDFCMTGKMGLVRNLETSEIIDQVLTICKELSEKQILRNIVFMGMGEPLHNYNNLMRSLEILTDEHGLNFSQRRITVSTSGLLPKIVSFGNENIKANLAISLNGVSDPVRSKLMPINKVYNLERLIKVCREFSLKSQRRVTFEYILIKDLTDSVEDAKCLISLLHGLKFKINLIPYNPIPGSKYRPPSQKQTRKFQKYLLDHRIIAPLRISKGQDIQGACGQLVVKKTFEK